MTPITTVSARKRLLMKGLILGAALSAALGQGTPDDPDYATILDQCEQTTTTIEDCMEIIDQSVPDSQVKVVVVHQRTLNDLYYNQVVIPVDYQGLVLGDGPAFNNMIYYPFEWRGTGNLGTRPIGPFNCTGWSGVQCCDNILAGVPDKDIMGNYVDCWLEESFLHQVDGEMIEMFRSPLDGKVYPLFEDRVRRLEERENLERQELILEINNLGTQLNRGLFAKLTNKLRHALRGYPDAQGLHYQMKQQLRITAAEFIPIANNTQLQPVLMEMIKCLENLSAQGGLHRFGGVSEGQQKDVIVLHASIDGTTVDDTAFLDLTDET